MNLIGFDIGSRNTKICINDGKNISFHLIDTFDFYKKYYRYSGFLMDKFSNDFRISKKEYKFGFCGYGRHRIEKLDNIEFKSYNELKMHLEGILFELGIFDFILLDIGGQDSKVISVAKGKMTDFDTNDKCAAGTGRFIENAARVMGMNIEEFVTYKDDPVTISSKCAVFAETEIIELMAQNFSCSQIAAGINLSVVKKVLPLIEKFNYNDKLVFSGGTALNTGVVYFLKKELKLLNIDLILPENPLYCGAMGVISTLRKNGEE